MSAAQAPHAAAATSPPNADIVAQITGPFGRWQLRTILLIFLCKIPSAWFMACVIYTAPTPQRGDYYCKPNQQDAQNISTQQPPPLGWVRMSHPSAAERRHTDRQFPLDVCNTYEVSLEQHFAARYANYTNPFQQPPALAPSIEQLATPTAVRALNVIPCEHFAHNSDYNSLVTQFDLVCSRQLLVSVTQSFHAVGALIGGIVAVKSLKHTSPRRLMLFGMLGQIFCGNLTGLVTTFHLHVYFRCLTSLFCALMYTSGQVILADITAGKARIVVTTLFELFWSIGLILLPGISIFFDSWSFLYVFISSSVIVLVFLHRWIADAPRWLLRHNQIDAALGLLLESAAYNNREVPLNLGSQLASYAKQLQTSQQPGYWSIWAGKTERKWLVAIHWAWVGAAVLYNVMLLMIRSLGVEHIHVNTVCLGFAEMVGVFLGLFFILYTRRRWLWAGYIMLAAGLLTYLVWLVPASIKESRRVGLSMIFWILLKLANSASLSVLTTCSGELVPVERRPLLMLSVVTFSRCWLLIAPFISTLSIFHTLVPITVFATLAVFNGSLMCLLNGSFWNREQPRIEQVLTPNTYRRNSAIVLLRRGSSVCSELGGGNAMLGFCDNPLTISISDLWHLETRFGAIAEYDCSLDENALANQIKETS